MINLLEEVEKIMAEGYNETNAESGVENKRRKTVKGKQL